MQTKHSVTKIELLAIVETLKEFQVMLWGQTFKVYTDHKNLTQGALGLISDTGYTIGNYSLKSFLLRLSV
jgi:hypothetical protein